MNLFTFFAHVAFIAAALLATSVLSSPLTVHRATDDLPYPLVPMFFNGTINGIPVTGDGTIEQIFAQQAAKNPHFSIPEPIPASDSAALVPRYKTNTNCIPVPNQNWKGTSPNFIRDGIKYLNSVTNFCTVWAKSCSRVSCSYDSAIIVCNDSFIHHHHSCQYIASYAQDILDKCSVYTRNDRTWRVGGQEWDTDRYNVIVRDEESHC